MPFKRVSNPPPPGECLGDFIDRYINVTLVYTPAVSGSSYGLNFERKAPKYLLYLDRIVCVCSALGPH